MSSTSAGIGSALPYQGDSNGLFLTTDGTTASWASVGGGSGVDTVGTFSASAQTNGASISSTTITFGPASATVPGMVGTGAQTFAGSKSFTSPGLFTGDFGNVSGSTLYAQVGTNFSGAFCGVGYGVGGSAGWFLLSDGTDVIVNAPGATGVVSIRTSNTVAGKFDITNKVLDLTGLGVGGAIKLKSPDGTTYTASIANGGTWSIA